MEKLSDNKKFVVTPETCERLCECGKPHPPAEVKQYTGPDAFQVLAEDCLNAAAGSTVLLIDDENTHEAAGRRVAECLDQRGVPYRVITFTGHVTATATLAGRVYDQIPDNGFIVAVGSGTINDLGKYAAGRKGIPYWSVPTAPSMNGYTSAIAAIKKDGVKRTLPSPPPQFIYIRPDVIRNAPLKLRQAGYCDLMAKSVSDVDWQIESMFFSRSYCPLPAAIVADAERILRDRPEKIAQGDEDAVMELQNGLLASGVSMSLAGSSAPASGGEHLFSHFLDMREGMTDRPLELHGLQVAAGIILSAACYRKLAALEAADLKPRAEESFRRDAETIAATWGDTAPDVEKRFNLKRHELLQLDELLPGNWPAVRRFCRQVREPAYYLDLIRRTGYEMTLDSLNLTGDEFWLTARTARTIRERLTVLDIAAHAGVLDDAAAETFDLLK